MDAKTKLEDVFRIGESRVGTSLQALPQTAHMGAPIAFLRAKGASERRRVSIFRTSERKNSISVGSSAMLSSPRRDHGILEHAGAAMAGRSHRTRSGGPRMFGDDLDRRRPKLRAES